MRRLSLSIVATISTPQSLVSAIGSSLLPYTACEDAAAQRAVRTEEPGVNGVRKLFVWTHTRVIDRKVKRMYIGVGALIPVLLVVFVIMAMRGRTV
jgi:hypothetical protein